MKLRIANSRFEIGDTGRRLARLEIVNPMAFTLIEILVVVALLSAIVLGLLAMFNQTQRAFRTGMTQVDVLAAGRIAADMIGRELEQVTPTYLPWTNNAGNIQPNLYVWLPVKAPMVQPLPGSAYPRTNLLEDLFFVFRRNQEWVGVGYFVRTNDPVTWNVGMPVAGPAPQFGAAGVLYRFETNAFPLSQRGPANLYDEFAKVAYASKWVSNTPLATRIMDGVIHFKLRAYDASGMWLTNNLTNNFGFSKSDVILSDLSVAPTEVVKYIFYSNAVPATVELEIGMLEDRAWDRFKSISDPIAQGNYIVSNTVGRMHMFRQRIALHNVDPAVYR